MSPKIFRYAWLIAILLSTTLACQLVSKIGETKEKVGAAATEAKAGMNMLGTAQALVTEVGGSQMLQTAQAIATEVGESGLLHTAMAVATEEGPSTLETAKAFATQEGPGFQETVQAAITQMGSSMGEPPVDIPIIEGAKEDFLSVEFLVSYSIPMNIQEVADFYNREMPAKGWIKVEQGSLENENMFALNFEKEARKAAITITTNPINQKTIVVIIISEQ